MFYCDGKICGFIVIEVYSDNILRNYICLTSLTPAKPKEKMEFPT